MNIGNPVETTINNLANILFEIFGKQTGIKYSKRDIDDPIWRRPNCDTVLKSIRWEPSVSLLEGLTKIVGEFKDE